jgi:hypothetical protein
LNICIVRHFEIVFSNSAFVFSLYPVICDKSFLTGDFSPSWLREIETKIPYHPSCFRKYQIVLSDFSNTPIIYGGYMQRKTPKPFIALILVLILVSLACSTAVAQPTSTNTPEPTGTNTVVPTKTPRPTNTPDWVATQRARILNAEAQKYFDLGYLATTNGKFVEFANFREAWAQLGWYQWWTYDDEVLDFYMSAHFKWSSAYRQADISGCGFSFAIQENGDQ